MTNQPTPRSIRISDEVRDQRGLDDHGRQERRDRNFVDLIASLQEYYKILAIDFNTTHSSEDEKWIDAEMKRVEKFILGCSEDAMNELRVWNTSGEAHFGI